MSAGYFELETSGSPVRTSPGPSLQEDKEPPSSKSQGPGTKSSKDWETSY